VGIIPAEGRKGLGYFGGFRGYEGMNGGGANRLPAAPYSFVVAGMAGAPSPSRL
jgi:hypothetical protein